MEREQLRMLDFEVNSWREQDERGEWWWHAVAVLPDESHGKPHQSRVSRQRAISYVLVECAQWLHDYNPTTKVD